MRYSGLSANAALIGPNTMRAWSMAPLPSRYSLPGSCNVPPGVRQSIRMADGQPTFPIGSRGTERMAVLYCGDNAALINRRWNVRRGRLEVNKCCKGYTDHDIRCPFRKNPIGSHLAHMY